MTLKIGFMQLVAEAEAKIRRISVDNIALPEQRSDKLLIDLRDVRELWREGTIPGSVHVPRGMLEFWVDPQSPYYNKIFADTRPLVLFCNKGWRSALATEVLQRMGLEDVCHLEGGFEAWVAAGGEVEARVKK